MTRVGNSVVSPTARVVSGTSVVATILLSSIGPRAIPGATSLAGKSTLLYGSVI